MGRRKSAIAGTCLLALAGVGCDLSPHEGTAEAAEARPKAASSPPKVTPANPPQEAGPTAADETAAKPSRDDEATTWPRRPEPPPASGDHIYSKSRHLWIRPQPRAGGAWLGYLSLGDAIRVKGGDAEGARVDPRVGSGTGRWCETWYAVEPVGYVCTGALATLDPDDPEVVELRRRAAKPDSPWPYRYGESLDAMVYAEPPSPQLQRQREYALDAHLEAIAAIRSGGEIAQIDERLAGVDLSPAGEGPPRLLPDLPPHGRPNQTRIHNGSTLAWVDSFDHAGRTFLLLWDGGIVPKDKVRPFPRAAFHGVILGKEASLPLAFFRVKDRPQYRRTKGGSFEPSGERWPRLSWVPLTGRSAEHQGRTFLQTEPGPWLAEDEAAVARQADTLPPVVARRGQDATWLDISILGGTLVAYEGKDPVYATMISPGRGGIPQTGVPTLETASTPTGTYSVLGKFLTATMQSSGVATLVHAEVQYTMNFSGPYAVHGAYWHDQWGEPKSGGCVNLSPIDAQRIFRWTEPQLPAGWHGMRTLPKSHDFGQPTLVHLRR